VAILLVPFLLHNNLMKGDGAGHLMLVEFTSEHLLPFGMGWCDRVWGGFPAGQLYPPLFHVLAGALALGIGAVWAVKALVAATWLAIPAVLFVLSRRLGGGHYAPSARSSLGSLLAPPPRGEAACAPLLQTTLFLAFWCGLQVPTRILGVEAAVGSNLESSLGNGMFPSAAGALMALLHLGELVRPAGPRLPAAAVWLALAALIHPVWGLTAGVCSLFSALRAGWKWTAGCCAWAFALAAFFAVPFLAHRDLSSAIHLPSFWPWWLWVAVVAGLVLAAWRWTRLGDGARLVTAAAAALLVLIAAGDLLGWRFHIYRLTIPVAVLLLPTATVALWRLPVPLQAGATRDWRGGASRLLRGVLPLLMLALAILFQLAGPVHPRGNPDLATAKLTATRESGDRVMVISEDLHSPGYMALPYAAIRGGAAVSHGISVESAPQARLIFGLMTKLCPGVFAWGVEMNDNPALALEDRDLSRAKRQLDLLGFSSILTDRKLPRGLAGNGRPPAALTFPNYLGREPETIERLSRSYLLSSDGATFQFSQWPLQTSGLLIPGPAVAGVPADLLGKYADRWFMHGGEAPVPAVLEGMLAPIPGATARLTGLSAAGDRLDFELSLPPAPSEATCPVYVKVPYHPHWTARDGGGNQLEVVPAGLGMLILARAGQVALEFGTGTCDHVGRAMSVAALLALLWPILSRLVRRRKERS
jgi:hypothetical protein